MTSKIYFPNLLLVLSLISIQIILLSNIRFTVWPEMMLYPYLMSHGFGLYKDIINPYFPLLPLMTAGYFSLVGLSVDSLKYLTWAILILDTTLLYFFGLKSFKSQLKSAFLAVVYILLSLIYGGNGLWFELMLSPLVLASLYMVSASQTSKGWLLGSGLLIGLGILIKQNAALFLIPEVLLILQYGKRSALKNLIYFSIPLLGLGLVLILGIIYFGATDDFINWAVKLPLSYTSQHGFVLLPTKKQFLFILIPIGLGSIGLFFSKWSPPLKTYWFLSLMIALSFCFPRYEDFHTQVLILLCCYLLGNISAKYTSFIFLGALVLFYKISLPFWQINDRFLDQGMLSLADKIKTYQSVYLVNSPELAYFYSDKLPPKPWATNFPWYFENFDFENRFISSIDRQNYQIIVVGDKIGGGYYDLGNYIPPGLEKYIQKNYLVKERYQNFTLWQKK